MTEQRAAEREFPDVARVEVMADVVVSGPVVLADVERVDGAGDGSEREKDVRISAVGDVVERMAVGVFA